MHCRTNIRFLIFRVGILKPNIKFYFFNLVNIPNFVSTSVEENPKDE